MAKPFLKVAPPEAARERLREFPRLAAESVATENAPFRVLSGPVKAPEDVPAFARSTMDGFAVRSADTFGATESSPALLRVIGEILMGEEPKYRPNKGEAVRIWTGGAVPPPCDAVVMVEHTDELDGETIEVLKAVAPLDNVVRKGDDFKKGQVLLQEGHRLRPQDIGLLAAMGQTTVDVFMKPVVAVVSSGDEIVPIDQDPPPGCMRDVNRHTLTAMVQEAHGVPLWIGIAPDRLDALTSLINRSLNEADVAVISGGSSMGSRDLVIEAIQGFEDSEILLHGVSVSPGKPLILARVGAKAVFGLPGHPVSAMVCFEQFVVPLLRHLEGESSLRPFLRTTLQAYLTRNVPSKEGRTDYVRVHLEIRAGEIIATPIMGKSGMISAMVRAHGFFTISADCEGLYKGDRVTVHLFSDWIGEEIEKKHLLGHEAPGRGLGDFFATPRQEQLSRI